jgi:hypothetical protein
MRTPRYLTLERFKLLLDNNILDIILNKALKLLHPKYLKALDALLIEKVIAAIATRAPSSRCIIASLAARRPIPLKPCIDIF